MQVDLTLKNARVYDVNRLEILLGEQFTLDTDGTAADQWFSNNDPVLSILADAGNQALCHADQVGACIIKIESAEQVVKVLHVEVVTTTERAADLGVTAGTPEPK